MKDGWLDGGEVNVSNQGCWDGGVGVMWVCPGQNDNLHFTDTSESLNTVYSASWSRNECQHNVYCPAHSRAVTTQKKRNKNIQNFKPKMTFETGRFRNKGLFL